MRKFRDSGVQGIVLRVLEYILTVGMDKVLSDMSDVTEEEVRDLPHVKNALKERNMI